LGPWAIVPDDLHAKSVIRYQYQLIVELGDDAYASVKRFFIAAPFEAGSIASAY
jgi:hypothetical protein